MVKVLVEKSEATTVLQIEFANETIRQVFVELTGSG